MRYGTLLLLLLTARARADSPHDFELYDLGDRLVRLATLRQSARLVLVDFFSETCAPCRAALPALKRLHARFASRGLALVVVAVPGDGDSRQQARRTNQRIFAEQRVTFPVVWDKYRRVAQQYGVVRGRTLRVPQVFLLDGKGALLRKATSAAALEAVLNRRLR